MKTIFIPVIMDTLNYNTIYEICQQSSVVRHSVIGSVVPITSRDHSAS